MSNLICLLTHCRDRGSEALVGCESHILHYEQVGFLHSFKFEFKKIFILFLFTFLRQEQLK